MPPDFSKYSLDELRQILRQLDTERFPNREEEIRARISAIERDAPLAPPGNAASVPDRSADLPILRRAGKMLLLLGAIDLSLSIWSALMYPTNKITLNFGALVGGVLLLKGGLRTASLVRWIACASIPAVAITSIVALTLQPFDLTWTQARLHPGTTLMATALASGYLVLLLWLVRELGRPPVLAARAAAGRPLRDMRIPFALGMVGAIVGASLMIHLLNSPRAERAEGLARQSLGAAYRFRTNELSIVTSNGVTTVTATVAAWNRDTLLTVPVAWKE